MPTSCCKPRNFSSTSISAKQRISKANRGEVWIVDLGLAAKVRPCLILSIPFTDQERSLVTVVAHTTSVRGGRFEAAVRPMFLKAGAFDAQNLVTIPEARLIRRVGTLRTEDLASIEKSVRAWLGL